MLSNRTEMQSRMLIFVLLPVTLFAYFAKVTSLGESVDIFATDVNYLKWIDALHELPFEIASIPEIYTSLFLIAAPEPAGSYLTYLLCLVLPGLPSGYYIDIYNVSFIGLLFALLYKYKLPWYLKLLLLFAVSFGYYEFTVLHSTHRFKIATILLIVAMLLRDKTPLLARNFIALAFMTHLSLFAMLPFLHILGKNVLNGVDSPPYKLIIAWGTLFYTGILLSLIASNGNVDSFNETIFLYAGNKISHARIDIEDFGVLILLSFSLLYIYNKSIVIFGRRLLIALSIAYLVAILLIVGTSTLLFSLYIMLMPILVAAYQKESRIGKQFIVAFLFPLTIYSLYKGATLAPLPLFIEVIN